MSKVNQAEIARNYRRFSDTVIKARLAEVVEELALIRTARKKTLYPDTYNHDLCNAYDVFHALSSILEYPGRHTTEEKMSPTYRVAFLDTFDREVVSICGHVHSSLEDAFSCYQRGYDHVDAKTCTVQVVRREDNMLTSAEYQELVRIGEKELEKEVITEKDLEEWEVDQKGIQSEVDFCEHCGVVEVELQDKGLCVDCDKQLEIEDYVYRLGQY